MTDRAVSTTLNYVLSLGIATLLVTGLLVAGGGFVDDRRQTVVRSELNVVGQQISADVARADRLVTAGRGLSDGDVQINQTVPERITGATYRIVLDGASNRLFLNASDPAVSVSVEVPARTALRDSTASGDRVFVRYRAGKLEVGDD